MAADPELKEEPVLKELEKQEVEIRERSRLELLQIQQKQMEEQNKKKKELLTKTIQEKSKQTRAETLKLQKIQKELQTLDELVSHDVSILRDRIEQACVEYSTARKRYEKAESEFVAAKLELHKKTELKEQLTEHLCTIIQQNESRKSRKLEELMMELQLSADLDIMEEEEKNKETVEMRKKEEEKMEGRENMEEENKLERREENMEEIREEKEEESTKEKTEESKTRSEQINGAEQEQTENHEEQLVQTEPKTEQKH